jgi:clan AA aspartic protease
MGMVTANIEIVRADDMALVRAGYIKPKDIKSVKVLALVDSGSYMMAINETIASQLDLGKLDEKSVQLADGTIRMVNVVGPIIIKFDNRKATCSALVLPGDAEVLLGAIPMEEMDVLIDPKKQKLIVNPDHPYQAVVKLKSFFKPKI